MRRRDMQRWRIWPLGPTEWMARKSHWLIAISWKAMGWFIVSIVLPLIAPLIALSIFKAVPLPVVIYLMAPFKDGQLCWGALGFCASALYEMDVPTEQGSIISHAIKSWMSGGVIALLVIAALLAAVGATFVTPLPKPVGVKWQNHFFCFLCSVVITASAACAYAVIHFGLLGST